MKKQSIVILLVLCLIGNTSLVLSSSLITASTAESITVSFEAAQFSTSIKEGYTSVFVPQATGSIKIPGHPDLPKITKTLTLPFQSTIESITVESEKENELFKLDNSVNPVSYPQPLNPSIEPMKQTINEQIYSSSNLYPKKAIHSTVGTGLKDNKQATFLSLNWYPVRYIPATNTLSFTQNISVTITYTSSSEIIQKPNENDLVIIGPEKFSEAIRPLLAHKNSYEVKTIFTSVEDIYQTYDGRDHAEQIKYYLYNTVKTLGTKHVMLLGSIDKTPMRRSAIQFYNSDDILTDLYYADLFENDGTFSSWDTNENNKFSEYKWQDGLLEDVDLYPDVHVGRLPCNNTKEVTTIVNKIIQYESNAASASWFNRILLMGGDTFPNHGVLEGEIVTQNIAGLMQNHGFEPIKIWTSQGTFNPLNINKKITEGAGFISYSGHGYEQGFGTSPPNVEQRINYLSPFLAGVFNSDKLPVIFFDACSTTKLDFTVEELHHWYPPPLVKLFSFFSGVKYEMDNYFPTISWQIVKKPNGGCIASVGATRVAFTGVDENGAHWGA
ncbi:MAG: hypothetical protein KGY50_01085 [Candidatus Thermoplasmatota archaeon]|nr:hypothetical protein [Candidatus Thermoplasmatota archaeon]